MNCDIPIIVWSLIVIGLSLIWDRATTVGLVLFAWAGAAAGGVVAFVCHYKPSDDRVYIEYIVPFALFGAMLGLIPGTAVRFACLRGSNQLRAVLEVLATAALFAGLGLIVGWITYRREADAIISAAGYSGVFAIVGAALAALNWQLRSRATPAAKPAVVPDLARGDGFA